MFRVLLGAALAAVLIASHDDHGHGDDDHDNDDALHGGILDRIRKIEDFIHEGGNLDATNNPTTVRTLEIAAWRIRELSYQPHNEKTCSYIKYYLFKLHRILQYINVNELEDKPRHKLYDALVVAREFVEEKTTDESPTTTQQQTTTGKTSTKKTSTQKTKTTSTQQPSTQKTKTTSTKQPSTQKTKTASTKQPSTQKTKTTSTKQPSTQKTKTASTKQPSTQKTKTTSTKQPTTRKTKTTSTKQPTTRKTKTTSTKQPTTQKTKTTSTKQPTTRKTKTTSTKQPTTQKTKTTSTKQPTTQQTTTAQATTTATTAVGPTTSGFNDPKEKLRKLLDKLHITQDDYDIHEHSEEDPDIKDSPHALYTVNMKLRYVIWKVNWLLSIYRYEGRAFRLIKHYLLKLWELLNKIDYHDIDGITRRKLRRLLRRLWKKFDQPQTTRPTVSLETTTGTPTSPTTPTSPPTVETSATPDTPTSTITTTPKPCDLNVAVSNYTIDCEVADPDHCHATTSGNQVDCRDHGSNLSPGFVTKITIDASHHGAKTTGVWNSCEVNKGEGYSYIPACESTYLKNLTVAVQHECLFEHVNHMDKKSIFLVLKPDNGHDKLLCGTDYIFKGKHAEVIHNDETSHYADHKYRDYGHNHYECLITTVTVQIWVSCDPYVPINDAEWKYRQIHDFFQTKCPGKACVDVPHEIETSTTTEVTTSTTTTTITTTPATTTTESTTTTTTPAITTTTTPPPCDLNVVTSNYTIDCAVADPNDCHPDAPLRYVPCSDHNSHFDPKFLTKITVEAAHNGAQTTGVWDSCEVNLGKTETYIPACESTYLKNLTVSARRDCVWNSQDTIKIILDLKPDNGHDELLCGTDYIYKGTHAEVVTNQATYARECLLTTVTVQIWASCDPYVPINDAEWKYRQIQDFFQTKCPGKECVDVPHETETSTTTEVTTPTTTTTTTTTPAPTTTESTTTTTTTQPSTTTTTTQPTTTTTTTESTTTSATPAITTTTTPPPCDLNVVTSNYTIDCAVADPNDCHPDAPLRYVPCSDHNSHFDPKFLTKITVEAAHNGAKTTGVWDSCEVNLGKTETYIPACESTYLKNLTVSARRDCVWNSQDTIKIILDLKPDNGHDELLCGTDYIYKGTHAEVVTNQATYARECLLTTVTVQIWASCDPYVPINDAEWKYRQIQDFFQTKCPGKECVDVPHETETSTTTETTTSTTTTTTTTTPAPTTTESTTTTTTTQPTTSTTTTEPTTTTTTPAIITTTTPLPCDLNLVVSNYSIDCAVPDDPNDCRPDAPFRSVPCSDHNSNLDPKFLTKITVEAADNGAKTTGVWDSCKVNLGKAETYIPACESTYLKNLTVTALRDCVWGSQDTIKIILDLKPYNGHDELLCGTDYIFKGKHAEVIHNEAPNYNPDYDDYAPDYGQNQYECLITTVTVQVWASCDPYVPINDAEWKYRQIQDFFQTKCPGKECVDVPHETETSTTTETTTSTTTTTTTTTPAPTTTESTTTTTTTQPTTSTTTTEPTTTTTTPAIITTASSPPCDLNVVVSNYAIDCALANDPYNCYPDAPYKYVDCRDYHSNLDPKFLTKITVEAAHNGAKTTGVWDSCEVNMGKAETYIPACESTYLKNLTVTALRDCVLGSETKSITLDLKPHNGHEELYCDYDYIYKGTHAEQVDGECLLTTVKVEVWTSCDYEDLNDAAWRYQEIQDHFRSAECPGKKC